MQDINDDLRQRMRAVEQAVASIGMLFPDNIDCLGLDQKILYLAEQGGACLPFVKAYYRPMQEPVLLSFWDTLTAFDFDEVQVAEIVSLFVGSRQQIRTKAMAGNAPGGSAFVFANRPDPDWIGKLQDSASRADGAIELAARLLQIVVIEHPFTDGNGRFSRALIYGALSRFGLIRNPCLGLNGVFELHRDAMVAAVQKSFHQSSLTPQMEAITSMLEDNVRLVQALRQRGTAGILVG